MDGFNACCCTLPSLHSGIECCQRCANNPWKNKNILKEWQNFKIDDIKKGSMEIEYNDDRSIIKITYYN